MRTQLFLLFSLVFLVCQQTSAQVIEMQTRSEGNIIYFEVRKNEPGTYTLLLEFSDLVGFRSLIGDLRGYNNLSGTGVLIRIQNSSRTAYRLTKDGSGPTSYRYKYRYHLGDYKAKPEMDYPYLLPAKDGVTLRSNKFRNLGKLVDKSKSNSVDTVGVAFSYQNGIDTICAMRSGLVVKVNDKERDQKKVENGQILFDAPSRSYIYIEHKDGSIAQYTCISTGEAIVKPNDRIIAGQPIAVFTKEEDNPTLGIHLYHLNKDLQRKTIIPKFLTAQEGVINLEFNRLYTSASTKEIVEKELSKKEKKRLNSK